ncbi:hypothetical protein Lalb_Chr23g0275471 [Lupinus albus]|uniref:Uncharacterized protein n=1 Tax=Lupinus albus TaxID=3870 RepID=A0A6A4MXA9_LUPAL|nr:hypothetical protein Lalb_Chr23g0275471 [Lupinus albus]
MPIKASADKLAREIQKFGNPPVFPGELEEQPEEKNDDNSSNESAPDKFKGKKSKAAAKSGGQVYQWEIMRSVFLAAATLRPETMYGQTNA